MKAVIILSIGLFLGFSVACWEFVSSQSNSTTLAMHLANEARSSPESWEPSYDGGIMRKRDRLLLASIPLSHGKWNIDFPSDPSWIGFTVEGPSTLYLSYAAWRVHQYYNEQRAGRF